MGISFRLPSECSVFRSILSSATRSRDPIRAALADIDKHHGVADAELVFNSYEHDALRGPGRWRISRPGSRIELTGLAMPSRRVS